MSTAAPSGDARPPPRATLADWRALPEEAGAELINGEIVHKALPTPEHGRLQRKLGALLDGYDRATAGGDAPGGWWLAAEVDMELGGDGVRPDLCGWRRDRVPQLPRPAPGARAVTERPDWVCEVLSPCTAHRDLGDKLGIYHRAGVGHYWVVDPANETLTVYRRTGEGYLVELVAGKAKTVRAEPFPQATVPVGALFDLARPESGEAPAPQ